MASLFQDTDGAGAQAQAVLAYLRHRSGIEPSWSASEGKYGRYEAEPKVDRWHNCREQGYVITFRSHNYSRQLNIAFFEHRNSDSICAIEWEQKTLDPPTIDNMYTKGKVYKDKYDVSHTVGYGEAAQMADWIYQRLCEFWQVTVPSTEQRARS